MATYLPKKGRRTLEIARAWLYRASNKSLLDILKTGIGAWIFSMSAAAVAGVSSVFEVLLTPFDVAASIMTTAIDALIVEPLRIVDSGRIITESALGLAELSIGILPSGTVDLGIATLPVTVVLVFGTFLAVAWLLSLTATSDTLPGMLLDNPLMDRFTDTPEDESD